jgi:hypothetical protein
LRSDLGVPRRGLVLVNSSREGCMRRMQKQLGSWEPSQHSPENRGQRRDGRSQELLASSLASTKCREGPLGVPEQVYSCFICGGKNITQWYNTLATTVDYS